jgi:hypothetical protein
LEEDRKQCSYLFSLVDDDDDDDDDDKYNSSSSNMNFLV